MFSGGADNAGRMFDVATGQATQVAQHDMPIKAVRWIDAPQAGILATASWDKTIKVSPRVPVPLIFVSILVQYWDLRTPNPVSTVTLPERCYTMDVVYPLMVVGTAERHIQVFNLQNPTTAFKVRESQTYNTTGTRFTPTLPTF